MHFLKLVTDGQMSNLFSTYCNLNEDTKNHGILGVWQPPTRRWRKQKHISFQKTSTSHYHYNFIAVYIYICIYIYMYIYIYVYIYICIHKPGSKQ